MTFTKDNNPYSRGQARMRELAAEAKAAIRHNIEALLAGLGREATEAERMQAEMLASLFYRSRQLRERGRSDLEVLRQAAELMRDVAFLRSPHAAAPPATEQ